jgi:hypothetical protein
MLAGTDHAESILYAAIEFFQKYFSEAIRVRVAKYSLATPNTLSIG